jgi:hypothetical protein
VKEEESELGLCAEGRGEGGRGRGEGYGGCGVVKFYTKLHCLRWKNGQVHEQNDNTEVRQLDKQKKHLLEIMTQIRLMYSAVPR